MRRLPSFGAALLIAALALPHAASAAVSTCPDADDRYYESADGQVYGPDGIYYESTDGQVYGPDGIYYKSNDGQVYGPDGIYYKSSDGKVYGPDGIDRDEAEDTTDDD